MGKSSSRRSVVPDPPASLRPGARERWAAVYPVLARRGRVDLEGLRNYCQLWARWRDAEDGLDRTGLTRVNGGRAVASPLVAIANQSAAQVRALEDRLGLSTVTAPAVGPEQAGTLVTRRELAEHCGVHMQTVTKWERDGMPIEERGRRGKPSLYNLAAVRAWLEARGQRAALEPADLAAERALSERAYREHLEIKIGKEKGALVPREAVVLAGQAYTKALTAKVRALPRQLVQAGLVARELEAEVSARCLDLLSDIASWDFAADQREAS